MAARSALVIGNANYQSMASLRTPTSDAAAISRFVQRAGFHTDTILDASSGQLRQATDDLLAKLDKNDIAFFWFSGHGANYGLCNLLFPVDANPAVIETTSDHGFNLDEFIAKLTAVRLKAAIVIADACRHTPTLRTAAPQLAGRGLSFPRTAADGMIVIYSAGLHESALDDLGQGDASPYSVFTRKMLQYLDFQHFSLRDAFYKAREEIIALADSLNHRQTPTIYDQLRAPFFLFESPDTSRLDASEPDFPAAPRPRRPSVRGAEYSCIQGHSATWEQVRECLSIDGAAYPGLPCASEQRCHEWWQRCPDTYTLLLNGPDRRVVGYANVMIINEATAKTILAGTVADPDISPDSVISTPLPGQYTLYVCSIAILQKHRNPVSFLSLFDAIARHILALAQLGVLFSHIIADAYTPEGNDLCRHIGMDQVSSSKRGSNIYTLDPIRFPEKLPNTSSTLSKLRALYASAAKKLRS